MKRNRETMKTQRKYDRTTETRCRARGSHDDAVAIVDKLLGYGGKTNLTHEQLAQGLGWERRMGAVRQTDMGRYRRALNHIKDGRANDGKPCTGFSIHYRTSGKENVMWLVDPSGTLQERQRVAASEIMGDMQQQVAFRTINGRRISTAHSMAEMCLQSTPSDVDGYQLMTTYAMELKRFGAPTDQTIAEINLWLSNHHTV